VETIFDNINVIFVVGIVSTDLNDSFTRKPQRINPLGLFVCQISGLNLSHPDSLKRLLRVPRETRISPCSDGPCQQWHPIGSLHNNITRGEGEQAVLLPVTYQNPVCVGLSKSNDAELLSIPLSL
jgi:hypothetical protein